MRKFNFIIGAVSGLFSGILLSNKKLRQKLKKADDPAEVAKILGKEMQRSGKEVAQETQKWIKSPKVQSWIKKAKRNCSKQCHNLQKEAGNIAEDAAKSAKKQFKKAKKIVGKKFK